MSCVDIHYEVPVRYLMGYVSVSDYVVEHVHHTPRGRHVSCCDKLLDVVVVLFLYHPSGQTVVSSCHVRRHSDELVKWMLSIEPLWSNITTICLYFQLLGNNSPNTTINTCSDRRYRISKSIRVSLVHPVCPLKQIDIILSNYFIEAPSCRTTV